MTTQLHYLPAASDFKRKLMGKIGGKNGWEKLAGKTLFQLVNILGKNYETICLNFL
jgi:hypothetical protein